MGQSGVIQGLKEYVAKELLEGQDIGLDETTPLLEWGIINSIEMARLVTFIENRWSVSVPEEMIVIQHFQSIESIAALVDQLAAGAKPS